MPNLKTDRTVSRAAKLSQRCSVEFTFGTGGFVCEWDPAKPKNGLTKKERRAYRKCRDEVIEEFSRIIGGAIVLAEPLRGPGRVSVFGGGA